MLKRKARCQQSHWNGLIRSSWGISYVEILVTLALMSIIVLIIPAAMLHSTKSTNRVDEKTVAESLTRTQIEYLKSIAYEPVVYDSNPATAPYHQNTTGLYSNDKVPVPDNSYMIEIAVIAVDPDTNVNKVTPIPSPQPDRYKPLESTVELADRGIQEITVTIKHIDRILLETTFYKLVQ